MGALWDFFADFQGETMGSYKVTSRNLPGNYLAHGDSPATKVSLLSTTNENKGVNINGSHQIHGKSSTDGTVSGAGKSGSLSLDALAKAKRALQMQKEWTQKAKKIPAVSCYKYLAHICFARVFFFGC